jgi:tetratricopeptide (TPR) repeat protein
VTRTSQRHVQYVVALAALAGVIYGVVWALDLGRNGLLVVAGLLFVPGRLHAFLWREMYRGRRLQASGSLDAALTEYGAFLRKLDRRPWLRHVWWLAWATYTRDARAMTLNNMGGCYLDLGHLEQAEACLREAIAIDRFYPVPYFNLGQLEAQRGNAGAAVAEATRARELGLTGGPIDRLIQRSQALLAAVEGVGTSRQA